MKFKYIAAANTTVGNVTLDSGAVLSTAGQPLEDTSVDVRIYKIILGVPVASANITIYNKATVTTSDTSNIAAKLTLPATISYQATNANGFKVEWDFGPKGLPVDGGNVMCDQACQITVLYGTGVGDPE
jgi:hypothetical protein